MKVKCHDTVPQARAHLAALEANIKDAQSVGKVGGEIAKLDGERQVVFGWAYTAEKNGHTVVDHSGDFIDKAALGELEDAVYEFNLDSRIADENHQRFEGVGRLVESVVLTPEKLEKMGLPIDGRLGWWVGFKIDDPEVWAKIVDGTYTAFSITGTGDREEARAA